MVNRSSLQIFPREATLLQRWIDWLRPDVVSMKGCLAAGFPFVFGFTVYESFETNIVAKTGKVPMPGTNENALGGHAVHMPYAYVTNLDLVDDIWNVRPVQ